MRTRLFFFFTAFLGFSGLLQPNAWGAIQSSGTLQLVGRVPEMARMALAATVDQIDLKAQAVDEPVAQLSIATNTPLMPIAVERIPSANEEFVFSHPPELSADHCDQGLCTIRASWKTRRLAKNGIHPVWVRITLSTL